MERTVYRSSNENIKHREVERNHILCERESEKHVRAGMRESRGEREEGRDSRERSENRTPEHRPQTF